MQKGMFAGRKTDTIIGTCCPVGVESRTGHVEDVVVFYPDINGAADGTENDSISDCCNPSCHDGYFSQMIGSAKADGR